MSSAPAVSWVREWRIMLSASMWRGGGKGCWGDHIPSRDEVVLRETWHLYLPVTDEEKCCYQAGKFTAVLFVTHEARQVEG